MATGTGTSGRGRGSGDTGRGKRKGRGSGEGICSDGEGDDEDAEEEGDEEDVGGDVCFERTPRSTSLGDYHKKPLPGQPKCVVVTFPDLKSIKEPNFKHTPKNILRTKWNYDTLNQKGQLREAFLDEVITEFKIVTLTIKDGKQ